MQVPEGYELVSDLQIDVPILNPITFSALANPEALQHVGKHLIAGPALTADVMELNTDADGGKLYCIFTEHPKELEDFFSSYGMTEITHSVLPRLWKDQDYALSIIVPSEHSLNNMRKENMRIFDCDCLAAEMPSSIELGITEGTYILRPKEMPQKIRLTKVGRMLPVDLVKVYTKAYHRMGFKIDYFVFHHFWRLRCAFNFRNDLIDDLNAFEEWRSDFLDEPITFTY